MKASTPPKLLPPFHSTAASGTFPTEHTNDRTATTGPTNGLQKIVSLGCEVRKNACQPSFGTKTASTPASSKPPAMSFQIDTQSMTNPAIHIGRMPQILAVVLVLHYCFGGF